MPSDICDRVVVVVIAVMFFFLSALWFSSAAAPTFSLSVLTFTHTLAQTHMNNVSGGEIAAGWQQRWFPVAIQNSLRERERQKGPTLAYQTAALCLEKSEVRRSGEDRNGSCLNSSREEMRAHQNEDSQWSEPRPYFHLLLSNLKERRREARRGGNWKAAAESVITRWPVRVAVPTHTHTHTLFFLPPISQSDYICTLVNKVLCLW